MQVSPITSATTPAKAPTASPRASCDLSVDKVSADAQLHPLESADASPEVGGGEAGGEAEQATGGADTVCLPAIVSLELMLAVLQVPAQSSANVDLKDGAQPSAAWSSVAFGAIAAPSETLRTVNASAGEKWDLWRAQET